MERKENRLPGNSMNAVNNILPGFRTRQLPLDLQIRDILAPLSPFNYCEEEYQQEYSDLRIRVRSLLLKLVTKLLPRTILQRSNLASPRMSHTPFSYLCD